MRPAALRNGLLLALATTLLSAPAQAFWVVNFGPAPTLPRGRFAFAGGMGGQVVLVGEPVRTSAVFFIPHAGFRAGLADFMDIGFRLAPIALPFSSVGPSLGGNIDVKFRLTPRGANWQFAALVGGGLGHVIVNDNGRLAYSPNAALLLSTHVAEHLQLTFMGRYVFMGIPTATGGDAANNLHIAGLSTGLKIDINPTVAVLPEIGAYWYEGRIADVRTSGPAFQYGVVLASTF